MTALSDEQMQFLADEVFGPKGHYGRDPNVSHIASGCWAQKPQNGSGAVGSSKASLVAEECRIASEVRQEVSGGLLSDLVADPLIERMIDALADEYVALTREEWKEIHLLLASDPET